ncbi:MAG: hypothetical protein L0Z50_09975, partial [Verrucomicrobiales bacterium]|nr:hypothetical protein [Verrucomicrobiales bacterium]
QFPQPRGPRIQATEEKSETVTAGADLFRLRTNVCSQNIRAASWTAPVLLVLWRSGKVSRHQR